MPVGRPKGYKFPVETIKRLSLQKMGDKNPNWKGDNVKYVGIHDYIKWHKPKENKCEDCGKETDFLDLANISQEYKRELNDWEWICRRCHMTKDGRIKKILVSRNNKNGQFQKR